MLVCLPTFRSEDSYALGAGGGGSARAGQDDSKPAARCEPSQNGLFFDAPQRHKPIAVRPARSNLFPSGSQTSKSPSTLIEPLLLMVIFADMPLMVATQNSNAALCSKAATRRCLELEVSRLSR